MTHKIELNRFVEILSKKGLKSKDIKEILEEIGVSKEKINSLVKEEIEEDEEDEEHQQIMDLEKEIISLNFDMNNIRNILDSYKKKVSDIEKKVEQIDNKLNNLLKVLEEYIPNIISKNNDK